MRIQLDTETKRIKVEQDILLSKLITTLDSLLPNKEWKKYTLETHTVINNWSSPTIIRERYVEPYQYPWITWMGASNTTNSLKSADYKVSAGVYNLEVK